MITKIQLLIQTLQKNPKQLFLIDGLGALLTIFFLAVVLTTFQEYIGMPKTALCFLSMIAMIYAIYSFSCYLLNPAKWQILLKIIAFANLTYCLITIAYMYHFYNSLTVIGLLYFIIEIFIIVALVSIEFVIVRSKQ
ncbi:hypothetical protein [Aquimarina rubra]|uniref:Uncharacterized protein n=1 Tax=Aquimarina rubra TaxID=1920033 RepID=A0ABW5LKT2_9FLAO